jgi:hypothetical protein
VLENPEDTASTGDVVEDMVVVVYERSKISSSLFEG